MMIAIQIIHFVVALNESNELVRHLLISIICNYFAQLISFFACYFSNFLYKDKIKYTITYCVIVYNIIRYIHMSVTLIWIYVLIYFFVVYLRYFIFSYGYDHTDYSGHAIHMYTVFFNCF